MHFNIEQCKTHEYLKCNAVQLWYSVSPKWIYFNLPFIIHSIVTDLVAPSLAGCWGPCYVVAPVTWSSSNLKWSSWLQKSLWARDCEITDSEIFTIVFYWVNENITDNGIIFIFVQFLVLAFYFSAKISYVNDRNIDMIHIPNTWHLQLHIRHLPTSRSSHPCAHHFVQAIIKS